MGSKNIDEFCRRSTKGDDSKTAKITKAIALHIRKCAWRGVERRELAAMFGISPSAVSSIKYCRTWSDV